MIAILFKVNPHEPSRLSPMRSHPLEDLLAEVTALVVTDTAFDLAGLRRNNITVDILDRDGDAGFDAEDVNGLSVYAQAIKTACSRDDLRRRRFDALAGE